MTTSPPRSRATSVVLALALTAGGVTALAGTASAAPTGGALLYGLTADNGLLTIRTQLGVTGAAKPITGLDTGDTLVGIDVRTATGGLYGVSKGNEAGDDNLYLINPTTAAATKVGSPLTTRLSGTVFGVDVNPVADAVRAVSDTAQNLAVNVTTGAVTVQTALTNAGLGAPAPGASGAAYTPPAGGATTLYDIDVARNRFYSQVPATGALSTLAQLSATAPTGRSGFDVDDLSKTGYASLTVGGTTGLYTIPTPDTPPAPVSDVLIGLSPTAATAVGAFNLGNVVDIAAAPSRIGFVSQDFTVPEAGGLATVTVTRSGDLTEAATASYATSNGTATAGEDYTATSGTVSFPIGASSATLSVPITTENVPDGDETFGVTLSNPSATTLLADTTATVTIDNDDQGPLLYALTSDDRLATVRVADGIVGTPLSIAGLAAGDNVVGIDVRPATGEVYAVAKGTSVDKIYTLNPSNGAATKVADLSTNLVGDSFAVDFNPVPDRLRIISTSGQNLRVVPSGATAGLTVTDAAITPTPTGLRGTAYTNSFGGATTTSLYNIDTVTDKLTQTADPNSGVLSTLAPLGVDASGETGFDIDAATGTGYATLTVGGVTSLYAIALPALATESSVATLIGGYTLPGIEDITSATPRLTVAGTLVAEGGLATVTVTRKGDTADPATVSYATSDSSPASALAGVDYVATSGSLSFLANEVSKTFTVTTGSDNVTEADETFDVKLSSPSAGSVLGAVSATVTITDSPVSTVSVAADPQLVAENAGSVTIPVTRTNPQIAATVGYSTFNSTATGGQDFAVSSGAVSFAAGETSKSIVIPLINDALVEPNESFGVQLSSPTAGAALGGATAVVTIVSDDAKQKTSLTLQATAAIKSPAFATVAGRLLDAQGVGLAGRTVYITVQPKDNSSGLAVTRTLVTQANGLYSTTVRPTVHSKFTAVYNGSTQDLGAASSTATVLVGFSTPTVNGPTTIKAGSAAAFSGLITPGNSRPVAVLQYLNRAQGKWVNLSSVVSKADGTYSLSRTYGAKGSITLRVIVAATARNLGTTSNAFVLKVT